MDDNIKKIVFGFIYTIIMFLIMDYIVVDVNLIIRLVIILVLFLIGIWIFKKLFIKDEDGNRKED